MASVLGDDQVRDRIVGCLVAGAVGDALGAPEEFASIDTIVERFGPEGITEVASPGHFTDDTQMTLFTCEALIHAGLRLAAEGTCHPSTLLFDSYQRWLSTQGWRDNDVAARLGGMLHADFRMHRIEAPGNTCLDALDSKVIGLIDRPINESKGCGGVMRAAPAGLLVPGAPVGTAPAEAYHLGCEAAAVTHGHPLGFHSAGVLAALVHLVVAGSTYVEAWDVVRPLTYGPMAEITDRAFEVGLDGVPTPQVIESKLGAGWVGEEALAIALACAVGAQDLESGLLASVNHSGDTDSTGAICGNLLGVAFGSAAVPDRWTGAVDAMDLVIAVATDVADWVLDPPSSDEPDDRFARLFERYVV